MRLPYRPRWLNRIYARLLGYFWLPCPLCVEPFGGHEWLHDGRHDLSLGGGLKIGTCPRCPVEVVAGIGEGPVTFEFRELVLYSMDELEGAVGF